MSSLHFLLHPSQGSPDELYEKLRDISSSISKSGYKCAPVFETLKNAVISQCVLCDSHIALLLQDGRVCRTTYTLHSDKLDILMKTPVDVKPSSVSSSSGTHATSRSTRLDTTTVSSLASLASASGQRVTTTTSVSNTSNAIQRSRTNRILQAVTGAGGRPAGVLLGRPPIPSSLVPNELVEQCMAVLQGKSRSLIVRELQRTNLDVNLAVNNLLSRDDEGDDDDDSQDGYMAGEDLMSLLDTAGDHSAAVLMDPDTLMADDLLNYPLRTRMTGRQSQAAPGRTTIVSSAMEDDAQRDSAYLRLRERRWLDPALREDTSDIRTSVERCFTLMRGAVSDANSNRKTLEAKSTKGSATNPTASLPEKITKASNLSLLNALSFGEQLQFMAMPEKGYKYCTIAALHSELVVLDTQGKLHQWKWSEQEPYSSSENPDVFHPKTVGLLLANEKVVGLCSSLIRCSVWTESNKIAVWTDDTLSLVSSKLDLPATTFPEFESSPIKSLVTSSLYTCALLENGTIHWWGVLPSLTRKKLLERAHQRSKKVKDKDRSTASDIVTGQQVCLKSNPLYHAGALAFNISGSVPKVGQLMAAAWSWTDVCRFQLKRKPITENKLERETSKLTARPLDMNADMPPPPSPASSTCSEQSGPILVSPGSVTAKRKRQPTPIKEMDKGLCDEEDWNIKDCIVVEDGKAANPVGRVIKIDGAYAAVKFTNNIDPVDDPLLNVRLLRKEDLQVVRGASTSKLPDILQANPRKIVCSQGQVLALAAVENELQLIVQTANSISYVVYDITANQFSEPQAIPAYSSSMLNKKSLSLFKHQVNLETPSSSSDSNITLLRDGNSSLYPLLKNSTQAFADPRWLDLVPVQSMSAHTESLAMLGGTLCKSRITIIALALQGVDIVRHILRCDVAAVRSVLANISQEPNGILRSSMIQDIVDQMADGGRNIVHMAAAMCTPTTNKESDDPSNNSLSAALDAFSTSNRGRSDEFDRSRAVGLREMMRRTGNQDPPYQFAWLHEMSAAGSANNPLQPPVVSSMWTMPAVHLTDKERMANAGSILNVLCESVVLEPYLKSLLSTKNTDGLTPFMQAISTRAYPAAIVLFNVARQIASHNGQAGIDQDIFLSMLFPPGSNQDDNPLHLLCYNDTCSFTWTGTQHINQDIYECKTCGLTGSLCCCSECAKVCHKGHNCKLKVTSPTAYCDCWEKCKCKALVAGNQTVRHELLNKLLLETDLVKQSNSKGENVLLFLVQTVGRQQIEQRQFTRRARNSVVRKSSNPADVDAAMPEHDLEPPKFAKKALERILNDWTAVKAMLMTGYSTCKDENAEPMFEEQVHLRNQSGTHLLDKFTHSLITKCSTDMLDALLTTLIREMQNIAIPKRKQDALLATKRFIRSVVRIFVVKSIESIPETGRPHKSNSYSGSTTISKCKRVFLSVVHLAVQELCNAANAVVLPVTLGVAKPTSSFSLITNSSIDNQESEELFLVDPLPLRPPDGDQTTRSNLESGLQSEAPDRTFHFEEEDLDNISQREQFDQPENAVNLGEGDMHLSEAAELEMDRHYYNMPSYEPTPAEGESDMDLDLLAESDTDNESIHGGSVHSVGPYYEESTGRNSGRNATNHAGTSDGLNQLAFFSEEDSNSSDEEVDSDEGQDSDQDYVDIDLEQLERRSSSAGGSIQRTHNAPPSMRWAVRQPTSAAQTSARQTSTNTTTANASNTSGLMYIDPITVNIRRANPSSVNNSLTTVVQAGTSSAAPNLSADDGNAMTTSSTVNNLSRSFGIILRQIADLLIAVKEYRSSAPGLARTLDYTEADVKLLQMYLEEQFKMVWNWLVGVMDSTEAQLRFGSALVNSTDSNSPLHPMNPNYGRQTEQSSTSRAATGRTQTGWLQRKLRAAANEPFASRHGFLSYILSLMRSYNDEHASCIPNLDVSALKHVAYIFDAMVYYMKIVDDSVPDPAVFNERTSIQSWTEQDDEESRMSADSFIPEELTSSTCNRHIFFQRSDSTTFLGCVSPDPIHTPLVQALPLAEKPQLLHPLARREELFGICKQPIPKRSDYENKFSQLPVHMGLGGNLANSDYRLNANLDSMGTYAPKDPPQDEPADLSIPRSSKSRPSNISANQIYIPSSSDSLYGLPAIGSKPTSVIVSNQSIISDTPQFSVVSEAITEQTIYPSGNRLTFFGEPITHECLIGRWRQTVQMFGHIFCDDVGAEPGSIINELGGFPVKESKFRREMEKLRNSQQRDISLEVERDRNQLIVLTIKQLNSQFNKRTNYNSYVPPLAVHRIKAIFKNEPGEGSGVARSFYTAFAQAVLSSEKLPVLEPCSAASGKKAAGKQSSSRRSYNIAEMSRSASSNAQRQRTASAVINENFPLSATAQPFYMPVSPDRSDGGNEGNTLSKKVIGERLYSRIELLQPVLAPRITGMILEMPVTGLLLLLASDDTLRLKVQEAVNVLAAVGQPTPSEASNPSTEALPDSNQATQTVGATSSAFSSVTKSKESSPKTEIEVAADNETLPLFHQPGKQGYYAPVVGSASPTRLNAFRSVGRVIGLCLLQNETCPLYLCRPVIKYILGRALRWHDLAFLDPTMYESLRGLLADTELKDASQILSALDLTFTVDDEFNGNTVELIPGGADIQVTPHNIYCYVRKYAQYKMAKCCEKALEQLRLGVHDVVPRSALEGLTAEDFCLLLNGQNEIDVQTLISYTSFNDESGESNSEKVQKFKKWFWTLVEKMNMQERQDLIYFWTSSPALPASEEGFQPMPTITIRPADDNHLPTANTCISRLYLPLYTSKQILKAKLLLAIKTKSFGFV